MDLLRVLEIIPLPSAATCESIPSLVQYIHDAVLATNQMDLISQFVVLWFAVTIAATVGYFAATSISYMIFFGIFRDYFHPPHEPQPFKGQEWLEAKMSMIAIPWLSFLTIPFFIGELKGHSKLYWQAENDPLWYYVVVVSAFILFTDMCIYWIHRWEHTFPLLYKYIHKPHHKWLVVTPFAAFAFHPLDGWAQALPYHIFVYLIPMNTKLYISLFVVVQLWSINIHDGVDAVGSRLGSSASQYVNGSLHHFIHHTRFDYNYGQYFTIWDRIMGSHYDPKPDFDTGDFNLPKQNYNEGMHPADKKKSK
ncbi:C-5 sterol desaturase [Naegleria gruberi]|uniref:C-5 sterol desaturase n=1 Tax=Naegleria gruberi TaxID=5762 RepID=D2UYP2_NAEGR|nr:C-5 sterol desaturase [Naegleria gruberi]EFC50511.1 C-5 sterol desaturase [Naegleria gruberi]|eukprot:XP_002683255.1 C-5 sterol desaturase [Naegleria gruberi strain NEG-M]